MAWIRKVLDDAAQRQEARKYNCRAGQFGLVDGKVVHGFKKYPAVDCHAEIVEGGQRARMTVTRIGAGALLAGPVGAIIGGMAKKDTSKAWLFVVTPAGTEQIAVNGSALAKAKTFVMNLELEAARQEQLHNGTEA